MNNNFPERDQSKSAEQQGMFRKFEVRRVDGSDQPGGKHHGCRYFVLDLDHDPHAAAAMAAYGQSCMKSHPTLGAEIVAQYPSDPWQPMESAPKDGTAVLALLEGSDIPHPVRWIVFGWRSSWDGYCIPPHDGPLCWMAIPAAPNQPPKGGG